MELKIFEGQNKNELSMIEVAHAILSQHGEAMGFADLANAIQQYLGSSDEEVRSRLAQFYTDLNVDGSFISLGDNTWGLRTWYPFDSIDEATINGEEDEDQPKRKKRRKVNAFLADAADDDDVIDYDDDDPEDDDFGQEADDEESADDTKDNDDDVDDEDTENQDTEEDLPDGIEGQLAELHDDDDDDEDEENDDDEEE
ncbi:DNA-directed RNA polymerase subunit delta [Furfurilactobacillus siliginis]|uniref:Probable DNA-directed RNA polymerase subunit delta n=1 Tax=Furfurilactobacillus siliginis TaxID=348151 RepID=A0A510VQE2_9LACO|nr:DNA-directed RNA polymerase subunit delta [Furfurilactobacillus siliginis]GEK29162.1 putative DNA-directed RNA polymerase subunit delta [Furfurilactobacillus siliginis]